MNKETIKMINMVLTSDPSVSKDHADRILQLCRQERTRRTLIGAQKAMEILQVSRPTLRGYVKAGLLSQINFSSRKVRFDENEVANLASNGAVDMSLCAHASSGEVRP